jgi:hypothetical protein
MLRLRPQAARRLWNTVGLIPSLQGLPSGGYNGEILAESNAVVVPVLPITQVASPSY